MPCLRRRLQVSGQTKLVIAAGSLESGDELAAEDAAENFHRQKEETLSHSSGRANTNSYSPAIDATYWRPFTAYVIGLFSIWAPRLVFQSSSPVRAFIAWR